MKATTTKKQSEQSSFQNILKLSDLQETLFIQMDNGVEYYFL